MDPPPPADLAQAIGIGPVRVSVLSHLSGNEEALFACASRACWQATRAEGLAPRVLPFPLDARLAVLPVRFRSSMLAPTTRDWWSFDPRSNRLAVRVDDVVRVWRVDDGAAPAVRIDLSPDMPPTHRLVLLGEGRWLGVCDTKNHLELVYNTSSGECVTITELMGGALPDELIYIDADVVFVRFGSDTGRERRESGFYDVREGGTLLVPTPAELMPERHTSNMVCALSRDRHSAVVVVGIEDQGYAIQLFGRVRERAGFCPAAQATSTIKLHRLLLNQHECIGASVAEGPGGDSAVVQILVKAPWSVTEDDEVLLLRLVVSAANGCDEGQRTTRAMRGGRGIGALHFDDELVANTAEDHGALHVFRCGPGDLPPPCASFAMHGYVDMQVDLRNRTVVAADPVCRTLTVIQLDAHVALK